MGPKKKKKSNSCMRSILTVDGIFKKERGNCVPGHKWTFIVKTCHLNSNIIYLRGKWPMNLQ